MQHDAPPARPTGQGERPAAVPTDAPVAGGQPAQPAEVWPKVKDAAGPRLRAMLDQMVVREATPRLLTLGVPRARAAMARDHLEEITRLVQQTGVRGMSISLVELTPEPGDAEPESAAAEPEAAPRVDPTHAEDHPLVREAARVFGAHVVHVEPKRPGPDAN